MRSLETLVRQLECEAERNADSIREHLQQIDTLQVRVDPADIVSSKDYLIADQVEVEGLYLDLANQSAKWHDFVQSFA